MHITLEPWRMHAYIYVAKDENMLSCQIYRIYVTHTVKSFPDWSVPFKKDSVSSLKFAKNGIIGWAWLGNQAADKIFF
jgi:hypothetical protein